MLLHDVGMSVPDADSLAFLHYIELLIKGHHLDTTILVADDALGHTIKTATVVSATLTNHTDRVHAQVHVDSRAWLKLRHRDEDWLAKRWPLLLLWLAAVGVVVARLLLLASGFHHFSL